MSVVSVALRYLSWFSWKRWRGKKTSAASPVFTRTRVRVHDATQLEVKNDFSLQPHHPSSRFATHYIDLYFFFPRIFEISPETYLKSQFYGDLRPLMRFVDPGYRDDLYGNESSDSTLENMTQKLETSLSTPSSMNTIDSIRVICCAFVHRLRRFYKKIERNTRACQPGDTLLEKHAIRDIKAFLAWLQRIERLQQLELDNTVRFELKTAHEYAFYRLRNLMAELNSLADERSLERDEILTRGALQLDEIAKAAKYFFIQSSSPLDELERYTNHYSMLKKHISQVLYLEVGAKPNLELGKHLSYMIAAGIAATWAFLANVMLVRYLQGGQAFGLGGGVDSAVSVGSLSVLLLFVGSYILKDRIKDIGKDKLFARVKNHQPDHTRVITYTDSTGRQQSIGELEESIQILKSDDDIPEVFKAQRQKYSTLHGTVLLYRKVIRLTQPLPPAFQGSVKGVRVLSRFSVRRFLARLGDPASHLWTLDSTGRSQKILAPKYYTFDVGVIDRSESSKSSQPLSPSTFKRVWLSKEGLVRVQQ